MKMLIGSLVTLLVLLFVFCVASDMGLFADTSKEREKVTEEPLLLSPTLLIEDMLDSCSSFRLMEMGAPLFVVDRLCIIDGEKKYAFERISTGCGSWGELLELREVEECPCKGERE